MKNTKVCMMSEPPVNSTIKMNKIKGWTGKDVVTTRALYTNSFSFSPKFTLFIQTNNSTKVSEDGTTGPDIRRRIRGAKFPLTFVNPDDYKGKPLGPNDRL